jgi:hypothetical protein
MSVGRADDNWGEEDDDTLTEFESAVEEALAQADEEALAQAAAGTIRCDAIQYI